MSLRAWGVVLWWSDGRMLDGKWMGWVQAEGMCMPVIAGHATLDMSMFNMQ